MTITEETSREKVEHVENPRWGISPAGTAAGEIFNRGNSGAHLGSKFSSTDLIGRGWFRLSRNSGKVRDIGELWLGWGLLVIESHGFRAAPRRCRTCATILKIVVLTEYRFGFLRVSVLEVITHAGSRRSMSRCSMSPNLTEFGPVVIFPSQDSAFLFWKRYKEFMAANAAEPAHAK